MLRGDGFTVVVDDVQSPVTGLVVHRGRVTEGEATVDSAVSAEVDTGRRAAVSRSHSATHLVHAGMRRHLGDAAAQAAVDAGRASDAGKLLIAPRMDDRYPTHGVVASIVQVGRVPGQSEYVAVLRGSGWRPRMASAIFSPIIMVVALRLPVMICGETGTGKEYLARALHDYSNRRHAAMVSVNCGSIPENLIESELFGYTRGAFSGALSTGMKGKVVDEDRAKSRLRLGLTVV